MNTKENPQDVINKFAKRQRYMPYIIGGLAGVLVLVGVLLIISVATGSGNLFTSIFSTRTPTSTATFTPTATVPSPTPTMTFTPSATPTETTTPTPSGPQYYTVQQGDDCWSLASAFEVDLLVLLAINNFPSGTCPIQPGMQILIPAPGQQLPTATPLPTGLPRGYEIIYTILSGETLADLATRFNSTVEDIMRINDIEDENLIYVGQVIKIRINLVTPTPTKAPTSTLSGQIITPQLTKTP
jgi:LysM repeat protein